MIELTINELIGLCAMAATCGLVFGVTLGGIVARWLDGRERRGMEQFFRNRETWKEGKYPDITDQTP